MEKIKIKRVERYRDGGTVVYEDELNRRYYMWFPTQKIYNQMPFPHGSIGSNDIPPLFVKEIKADFEIVESF